MADLNDLAASMYKLATRIPVFGNQVAKDTASTILKDLTQVTPTDTGAALSNWQLTLDSPAVGIVSPFAPSPKGTTRKGVWTHRVDPLITAQANAQPTLDAGLIVLQGKAPGQSIFIANNLEYIAELDAGSSQQVPAAFVDRAMILGFAVIQNAKL